MTWQPIETAPTNCAILVGRYDEDGDWIARVAARMTALEGGGAEWVYARKLGDEPIAFILRDVTHWQPLPAPPATSDTAAFLARMAAAAEAGERVTADDVARLRRLANWADAPPAPGWNGTLDRGEARRAIEAARKGMRDE